VKQVLQNLKNGETLIEEVPAPVARDGSLRISTRVTLVSAGTERMLVDFARGSLISKARQQPDKVRQTLEKAGTDGLMATVEAVRSKLDEPLPLGYCNVGVVVDAGGSEGFAVGDRVVSNGSHAEVVVVPRLLCARIPEAVPDDHAAFTVLGAIALQGVRLAQPTLGEAFVVSGLGLIGLITVQLLIANGCRVMGIDSDPARLDMARHFGAETCDLGKGENPLLRAQAFSRGRGVDGVLLTLASASDEPVSQAARMCRKRGRVVLVGVTGLKLNRSDFFESEVTFQVSCSYGPGRYDPLYEQKGRDYPFGFVRWTEQRNLEAILDLMASGRLDVGPLISHRMTIAEAGRAYDLLASGEPSMGILLDYPFDEAVGESGRLRSEVSLPSTGTAASPGARMAFIGAGNYGGRVLVQAFKSGGAALEAVVSSGGVSAARTARKFGIRRASSDSASVLVDPEIDAVCIATRHDTHAPYVLQALNAGKHVFVEKPLCLTDEELDAIVAAATAAPGCLLTVGFNRRFAPMVVRMRELLASVPTPKAFIMTVNSGAIPTTHWTQDPQAGGGRLVGEACHFVDLLRHLAGTPVVDMSVNALAAPGGPACSDVASISLTFADGSIGTVHYLANGHKAHPKERLEVFAGGKVILLDNFRRLTAHGFAGFSSMKSMSQDKGQTALANAFVAAMQGRGPAPIPIEELLEVSRLSIRAAALASK
jgi:predicted dehydrogenase/threonine dehydrogenase-like Zn-dependent dehydrogenase